MVTPMINAEIRKPSPAYYRLREFSGDFTALETEIISLNYEKLPGKATSLLLKLFGLSRKVAFRKYYLESPTYRLFISADLKAQI